MYLTEFWLINYQVAYYFDSIKSMYIYLIMLTQMVRALLSLEIVLVNRITFG